MARDYTYTPRVLSFMTNHPGVIYTIDDVTEALGIEREKVTKALGFLAHRKHTIKPGDTRGTYYYSNSPDEKEAKASGEMSPGDLFEYVGKTKNGDRIARGPDDNIYTLTRL